MIKEQEEAIEILEEMVKSYIEADECGLSNNDFKHEIKAMQTALNILKEKDKEIEKLEKQSKNLDKQAQQYFEQTIYLDKQIDLMAEFIEKTGAGRKAFSCTFRKNDKCDENGCRHCIKQYFERKSKE